MNENDIINHLLQDINLHEAIKRHEQKMPPIRGGLNERVMQRMKEADEKQHNNKRKIRLSATIISSIAATFLLFLLFRQSTKDIEIHKTDKPTICGIHTTDSSKSKKQRLEIEKEQGQQIIGEHTEDNIQVDQLINQQVLAENTTSQHHFSENKGVAQSFQKHPESLEQEQSLLLASNKMKDNNQKEVKPVSIDTNEKENVSDDVIPDTLGNQILESPENMLIALQMLSECEATIQRETQDVRNCLIEASFNVVPPSRHSILVIDENGDYDVLETRKKTVVEL